MKAKALRFSPQLGKLSQTSRTSLERVADKLQSSITTVLDREEAPFRICRWIAWGRWHQNRALRLWLVLHLRREPDVRATKQSTTGWSWPKDHVLAAGERSLRATPQYAKLKRQGLIQEEPPDNAQLYTFQWAQTWQIIERELSTVDTQPILEDVRQQVKKRKKKRVKKHKLRPEELAAIDALNTLKRLVVRGVLTLGELTE